MPRRSHLSLSFSVFLYFCLSLSIFYFFRFRNISLSSVSSISYLLSLLILSLFRDRKKEITENITCTLLFLGVEQRTISTVGCGGMDVTLGCCSADFARANPNKRPIWTSKERSASKSKERSAFTVVDTSHTMELVCGRPQIAATGLKSTESFEPSVDKIHKLALKMQVPLTCAHFNIAKLLSSPLFGQKGTEKNKTCNERETAKGRRRRMQKSMNSSCRCFLRLSLAFTFPD